MSSLDACYLRANSYELRPSAKPGLELRSLAPSKSHQGTYKRSINVQSEVLKLRYSVGLQPQATFSTSKARQIDICGGTSLVGASIVKTSDCNILARKILG